MNEINRDIYRIAFEEYIRRGTPITLTAKQMNAQGRYVWRTQRDAHVRTMHRMMRWSNIFN